MTGAEKLLAKSRVDPASGCRVCNDAFNDVCGTADRLEREVSALRYALEWIGEDTVVYIERAKQIARAALAGGEDKP